MALQFLNSGYFAGLVGIGTTPSVNILTVKATNATLDVQSTGDSQTVSLRTGYLNSSSLAGYFRYTTGDAQLYIDNNYTGNNGVYSDINIRNKTASNVLTTRMKIKGSSGFVGINTVTPKTFLDVGGQGNRSGGNIIIGPQGDGVNKFSQICATHYNAATEPEGISLIGAYSNSTTNSVHIGGNIYESNPATDINFWTHTATTHAQGGTQRMIINSAGAIRFNAYGAGTLVTDASGNITATATPPGTGVFLPLAGGRMTTTAKIEFYNASQYIYANSTNDLTIASGDDINFQTNYARFFNAGIESARISATTNSWIANGSNSKLGVNKTNPTYNLDVEGTFRTTGAATIEGALTGTTASFNSGASNVVASFISTDGIAGIKLQDSVGNVELSASSNTFQVQPAGGAAALSVTSTAATFVGTVTSSAGGFRVNYIGGSTVPMVVLEQAPDYGIFYREATPDFIEFKHNGSVKQSFDGSGNVTLSGKGTSVATVASDGGTTLTTKSYVDGLVTGVPVYKGTWDARTQAEGGLAGDGGNINLRLAANKVLGNYYIVETAGSATPNGANTEPSSWNVGDWCIFSDITSGAGTDLWQRIDNSSVISGAGTGEKLAKWAGASNADSETLTDSSIADTGSAVTIGNPTTITGPLTVNIDADDTVVIKSAGTDAAAVFAASGDELYLGGGDSYSVRYPAGNNFALFDNSNPGIAINTSNMNIGSAGPASDLTSFLNIVSTTAGVNPTINVSCDDADEASLILSEESGNQGYGARLYYQGLGNNFFNIQIGDVGTWTNRFTIDRFGDVGIGILAPQGKMTVVGATQTVNMDLDANSAIGLSVMGVDSGNFNAFTIGSANSQNNAGVTRFKYNGAGSTNNYMGFGFYANDDILNVRANGRVGIGTTDPQAKLHILNSAVGGNYYGQLVVETSGEAAIQLKGTTFSSIYFSDAAAPYQSGVVFNHSTNKLELRGAGNADDLTITEEGDIGIGTDTPGAKLEITGTAEQRYLQVDAVAGFAGISSSMAAMVEFDNGGDGNNVTIKTNNSVRTDAAPFSVWTNTNSRFIVRNNGSVGIGTASPGYELSVNGNIEAGKNVFQDISGKGGFIMRPWGADYLNTTTNVHTGAIKITLPTGATSEDDMIKFTIDIYQYQVNQSLSVDVGGYIYLAAGSNDSWRQVTAIVHAKSTTENYTVRFGDDGTNHCVWIGELNTVWNHPNVICRNFYGGFAVETEEYLNEWDISFEATSFSHVSQTQSNNFPLSSGGVDGAFLPLAGGTMAGIITGKTAGNSSINLPALEVVASGTANEQASIAIQQKTSEGDTIIFADYEPHVEWGISTENGANLIHFTGGSTAGGMGSKTFYNNSGNARTAYIKFEHNTTNGNTKVGGTFSVASSSTFAAISGTTGSFTGLVSGITPVAAANFVTKAYVDGSGGGTGPFLPLAGGTLSSTTSNILILNPTANNYGGILFQYGGTTKGTSIYNSGGMVYGGESGNFTRLQAGGQYGLHMDATNRNVHIGGTSDATYKLQVAGTGYYGDLLRVDEPVYSYTDSGTKHYTHLATGSLYGAGNAAMIVTTNIPGHNQTGNANMFSFNLVGYSYAGYGMIDMTIGVYAGENNYYSSSWTGTCQTNWINDIYVYTDTNGKVAFQIGAVTDALVCEIAATNFVQGFGNVNADYSKGWTITAVTTLPTQSNPTSVPYKTILPDVYEDVTFHNNVGIGTTSPSVKLDVRGAGTITRLESSNAYVDSLYINSGATNYLSFNNSTFQVYCNGGSASNIALSITPTQANFSGDVGIGLTTTPLNTLHVAGSVRATSGVYFNSTSTIGFKIENDSGNNELDIYGGSLVPGITIDNSGHLTLGNYGLSGSGTPVKFLGLDSNSKVVTYTSGGSLPGGPYLPLAGGTMTGNIHYSGTNKATFGTAASPELKIYNQSTSYNILESSIKFDLNVVELDINGVNGTTPIADLGPTDCRFAYSGAYKLYTTTTGITVANTIDFGGGNNDGIIEVSGSGDLIFKYKGSDPALTLDGGAVKTIVHNRLDALGIVSINNPSNNESILNIQDDGTNGHIAFENSSEITGIVSSDTEVINFRVGDGVSMSDSPVLTLLPSRIGINTTSPNSNVALEVDGRVLIKDSSGVADFYLGNYETANFFRFHTNNSDTYFDMNCGNVYWRDGSSIRYRFFPSTANMTINGTLTQNSDIRIKENVVEIDNCISKVQAMRGVYYNRTDFNTEVTKVGVIAQEVEAVLPELILENEDDGLKSVAYSELTAVLINAIKEQQEIIEDLKTRITKLEN